MQNPNDKKHSNIHGHNVGDEHVQDYWSKRIEKKQITIGYQDTGPTPKKHLQDKTTLLDVCQCTECGKSLTKDFNSVRAHMVSEHTVRNLKGCFQCKICGKTSVQPAKVNRHMGEKHTAKILGFVSEYQCTECDKSFNNNMERTAHIMKEHTVQHSDEAFQCGICDQTFPKRPNLRRHIGKHIGIGAFPCTMCGESFKNSGLLARHIRQNERCKFKKRDFERQELPLPSVHSGQTKCSRCDIQFSNIKNIKWHMKMHDRRHMKIDNVPSTSFLCGGPE